MSQMKTEEIVGYLPYGLKWINEDGIIVEMDGIGRHPITNDWEWWDKEYGNHDLDDAGLKPILHHLASLIEHSHDLGDSIFELMHDIDPDYSVVFQDGTLFFTDTCDLNLFEVHRMQKFYDFLYKHHIDIHNLIPRGLAVDINSLNDKK